MKLKLKSGQMQGGWRVYLFSPGWFFNTREFPGTEYLNLDANEMLGVQIGDKEPFPAQLSSHFPILDNYIRIAENFTGNFYFLANILS